MVNCWLRKTRSSLARALRDSTRSPPFHDHNDGGGDDDDDGKRSPTARARKVMIHSATSTSRLLPRLLHSLPSTIVSSHATQIQKHLLPNSSIRSSTLILAKPSRGVNSRLKRSSPSLARTSPTDQGRISPTCFGLAIQLLLFRFLDTLRTSGCYRNPILTYTIFTPFSNVMWHSMAGCVCSLEAWTLCAKIGTV